MTTRRQVLKGGATALTLTSVGAQAFSFAAGPERKPLAFDRVIVDARIADREARALIADASAAPCVSIQGDLAKLWFDSLRDTLLKAPTVFAGITADLDAEVMRAFARDVGYQQRLRADITINVSTGRLIVRRSDNAARSTQSAISTGFEDLINFYKMVAMPVQNQRAQIELTAWVIAPIRG